MKKWTGWMAALVCLCLLAGISACALAEDSGEAEDITRKCTIKVSEGDRDKLLDGNVRTHWTIEHRDAYVGIRIPDGRTAGWLRVEWFFEPTDYDLIEYDADKNEIQRRDETCQFPNIYSMYELLPETKYVKLELHRKDQKIASLRVYDAGTLSKDIQMWEPPVDKADLMVVSAHEDDELIFFGGTIPYYNTALKKSVEVVYMCNCSRNRRRESLEGLWVTGMTNYPDFINLPDDKADTLDQVYELWGGKDHIVSLLVQRIRHYKPEVIVTHDLNGEYGHRQHMATARAMLPAIEAAADPTRYPETAEIYGTWQVKKLYHHLSDENTIMMDWETKLDSLNGYSPLQVAQLAFKKHSSQDKYYNVKSHSKFDNAKFGLHFTTVGEDVEKKDFLENIDPDASAKYVAEHAEEIAAYPRWLDLEDDGDSDAAVGTGEEPEDVAEDMSDIPIQPSDSETFATAQPEAAPQPEVTAQPAARPKSAGKGSTVLAVAMIALGLAAVGAGGWYAWRMFGGAPRHGKRRRR